MKKGIKTKNQIAGVDVGGTFTDLISTNPNDNSLSFVKVPTTIKNQALGVMKAILREAIAGALLGLLMLLVVVPFAWWRGDGPLVGAAVGISLMAITTLAATAGAALPLLAT